VTVKNNKIGGIPKREQPPIFLKAQKSIDNVYTMCYDISEGGDNMTQHILNIRMDASLKRCFESVCDELGLNMSTAITIFAKTVCRERRIPFEITLNTNASIARKDNIMNKTTYRICLEPEYGNTVIANVDETFNDFEEAFKFFKNSYYKMLEEMRGSDDDDICRSGLNYAIEVIKPESLSVHKIIFADEFTYIHNDVEYDMYELLGLVDEENDLCNDDDLYFEKLYAFIKEL